MDRIVGWGLWHLTESGWVSGTWRIGDEGEDVDPPIGCVKTCRYMELLSEAREGNEQRVHRIGLVDEEAAQRLELHHGPCPRRIPLARA